MLISTENLGFRYGPLDDKGLPILGIPFYEEFMTGEWNLNHWPNPTTFKIPNPGYGSLNSVILSDGEFSALGREFDPPLPGLWFPEDCRNLLRLFHENLNFDDIVYEISLNDLNYGADILVTPNWLEFSDVGKTLVCVSYWLTELINNPKSFSISSSKIYDAKLFEKSTRLIDELVYLKESNLEFGKLTPVLKTRNLDANDVCIESPEDSLVREFFFKEFNLDFSVIAEKNTGRSLLGLSRNYSKILTENIFDLLPVMKRYSCLKAIDHAIHQLSP